MGDLIIVFTAGAFCGGTLAMVFGQRKQIEVMTNLIQYGRPTTPVARVFDPGTQEEQATVKLREREHDTLRSYLMNEGIAADKADEEAARMLRHASGST